MQVMGRKLLMWHFNNPDIDVILMDIQIPIMDGYAAMKKIREFRENIIIIAQTAYGLLGDKEKILNSGFNDYIIKPILTKNLIEKLNTNLKLAKTTQSYLK